jgi:hypothetical protein
MGSNMDVLRGTLFFYVTACYHVFFIYVTFRNKATDILRYVLVCGFLALFL